MDDRVPLVKSGPAVEAARAALLARAEQFGHVTSALSDLHVLADSIRFEPVKLGDKRYAFVLPPACKAVALVSRTLVPAHLKPDSTDSRVLGVAVKRLQVAGEAIDLTSGHLAEGWHAAEDEAVAGRRWTTGAGRLPTGARLVVVDLTGDARYRIKRKDNVVALRA